MNLAASLAELTSRWPLLIFIGIRVVFIALVFEFLAWFLGRRIEKMTSPFANLDAGRDPKWRAMRRAALQKTPRIVLRSLLYTIALILVLDAFGLQILPLSLAVASVSLLFGAAMLPLFRDYAQGYILLSEDTLAPGDTVQIGAHIGQVEKWTLRATWLRDQNDYLHVLSNREVRDVIIQSRAAATEAQPANFDPLGEAPKPQKSGRKTT